MTYDGKTLAAYVNGTLAASAAVSGAIVNYDSTNGLAIGGGYTFGDPSSSGIVADVAVYGSALSADRILTHYNAGIGSATAFDDAWPHFTKKSANGVMQSMCDGAECAPSGSFDPVDGAVSGIAQTASSRTYVRDTEGRQTNSALTLGAKNGNYTRSFDGEHHLVNHAFSTYDTPSLRPDCAGNYADDQAFSGTMSYGWGPDGHVVKMAGDTVHWDGNHVLFTTTSSGQVDDVKLRYAADINPQSSNRMVVWDRDFSGIAVTNHSSDGFGGWGPPDPYGQRCAAGAPDSSSTYSANGKFEKVLSNAVDGITDGINVIQGEHAFDPIAGQWMTQDSQAGFSTNANSQKQYIWNNNNPVDYADPTGDDTVFLATRPALPGSPDPFDTYDHAYYVIVSDDGTQTSIGGEPVSTPTLDPWSLEGQLNTPADSLSNANGLTLMENCQGVCQGEQALIEANNAYVDSTLNGNYNSYLGATSNSNSYASYLGDAAGYNLTGLTNDPSTPGLFENILPNAPASQLIAGAPGDDDGSDGDGAGGGDGADGGGGDGGDGGDGGGGGGGGDLFA